MTRSTKKSVMKATYLGSCLCGDVQFSVTGFSTRAANCHCSMCRKFHGAAFGTCVEVAGLIWLQGRASLKDYIAKNGTVRTFCVTCGSSLGFRNKGAKLADIELAIATFDSEIPAALDAQIFTDDKVAWCDLYEHLPNFPQDRERR